MQAERPAPARQSIGPLADFPKGECRILTVNGVEIGVFNLGDTLRAMRNYCPHQGAPVCKGLVKGTMLPSEPGVFDWGMEGELLFCPWHNWGFQIRTGRVAFGPEKKRLILYDVEVSDGQVYVRVPAPKPASSKEDSAE
jgi:nitrite reductase (NADH) small subunit